MSDDAYPARGAKNEKRHKSFFERLAGMFEAEPETQEQLLEILHGAHEALHDIEHLLIVAVRVRLGRYVARGRRPYNQRPSVEQHGWQFCGGNDYAPRVVHGVVFPAVGCHGSPLPAGTHGVFLDAERLDFAGKLCGGLAGMPTLQQ